MKQTTWADCYDDRWTGFIVPASFAHPAKYSKALIERIYDHMLWKGWLVKGAVVGDCFGGVATGGLIAAYRGLEWVGVELEGRFCNLALDNFLLHSPKWCHCDNKNSQVHSVWLELRKKYQGDKPYAPTEVGAVLRKGMQEHLSFQGKSLDQGSTGKADGPNSVEQRCSVVRSNEEKTVCAGEQRKPCDGEERELGRRALRESERLCGDSTKRKAKTGACSLDGNAPGQADDSRRGGSPSQSKQNRQSPFQSSSNDSGGTYEASRDGGRQHPKEEKTCSDCGGLRIPLPVIVQGDSRKFHEIVREVCGVVTSPPYADSIDRPSGIDPDKVKKPGGPNGNTFHDIYGESSGQIGRLKEGALEAVVTSPPWESNCEGGVKGSRLKNAPTEGKGHYASPAAREAQMERDEQKTYGESPGQIGKDSGETYWIAMKSVYSSCFLAIKPGGFIGVVVKDYVKNKQVVPLCDDTARLLEHCGFVVVERVHAMLVKKTSHDDLFNGATTQTKSRKSFFRRLAEAKGSPEINFEQVIFAQKL